MVDTGAEVSMEEKVWGRHRVSGEWNHGNRSGSLFPPGLMIRDYENPLVSLNKAVFIRAGYFLGGGHGALGGSS